MPKLASKPTWEFLWWRDDDTERQIAARYYVSPTITQAATKMVKWIERQSFAVCVDYEARAMHVKKRAGVPHETVYPNLLSLEHSIREYI